MGGEPQSITPARAGPHTNAGPKPSENGAEMIVPEALLLAFRSDSEMSGRDFEETVKQEEDRLRAVHPTTEDIPGCMALLDDFLSCNSGCSSQAPT